MNTLLLASDHWGRHHDGWFPFFPLIPLFFIGVWVVVIVSFRRRWRHGHHLSGESVLAERFARGEIDEAEYLERRSVLRRKD
jgi:putative membrane protein